MTIIADLTVDGEAVPVGISHEGRGRDSIRILGQIPTDEGSTLYLWLESTNPRSIPQVSPEPVVTQIERVDTGSNYRVVAVTTPNSASDFLNELKSPDVVLLQGIGTDDGWLFRLRFPDQPSLATLVDRCTAHDIPVSIIQQYQPTDQAGISQHDLTPAQRETLRVAKQAGYFEIPRETTMAELSALLEVSDTAVSQRLRRGLASLLDATITTDQRTKK